MSDEITSQPKRLAYKLKEAAQLIGVSESSLRRVINSGQLRSLHMFRHILIPATELERFIELEVKK